MWIGLLLILGDKGKCLQLVAPQMDDVAPRSSENALLSPSTEE